MTRCVPAALLALVLAMGVPLASPAREASPTGARAATPTASGAGITTEVLAVVRLPAVAVPPPPAIVAVWIATLAPGEALAFGTGASPPSIVADVVLGGELVVRSAGRLWVQRAAGREDVPANTAVTVRPGEAVVYVDNRAAQSFRNPGRGTLTAISFGVYSAAPPSTFTAGPVSQADWERSGLAGHDLVVTVERLAMPAGASLPAFAPDVRAPRVFAVAAGAARTVIVAPTGEDPPTAERFGLGQVIGFRTLGEGERLQVRNAAIRPLVLLRVTLSAGDAPPRMPSEPPLPAPTTRPGVRTDPDPTAVRVRATPARPG
jgi:hypothetical protein